MKKLVIATVLMLAMAVSASAMSHQEARRMAFFLTDKMAYELNLSRDQYDAAYEINYDYLLNVRGHNTIYGTYWNRRNIDLSFILGSAKFSLFKSAMYFYRPIFWGNNRFNFYINSRYTNSNKYYFGHPSGYSKYRGGHSWKANNNRSFYNGKRFGSGPSIKSQMMKGNRGPGNKDNGNRGNVNRGPGNKDNGDRGNVNRGPGNKDNGNRGNVNRGPGNKDNGDRGNVNRGPGNKDNGNRGNVNRGPGNKDNGNRGNVNRGPGNKDNGNRGNVNRGPGNKDNGNRGNVNRGPGNKDNDNRGNGNSEGRR